MSAFTESLDQAEDHLIFGAVTDGGAVLDDEWAARLFTLPGSVTGECSSMAPDAIEATIESRQSEIQRTISHRNALLFGAEAEKLEGWADDLKLGLEREIKEIDRQIKEARRAATAALMLEDKLAGQKRIRLESLRNDKRRSLFGRRTRWISSGMLISIEGKLTQTTGLEMLFTIRWTLA